MQELDEILKKIERYIEIYQMPPLGREVEGTVELLKECRNVIRKHMANRMYEKNTEIIAQKMDVYQQASLLAVSLTGHALVLLRARFHGILTACETCHLMCTASFKHRPINIDTLISEN